MTEAPMEKENMERKTRRALRISLFLLIFACLFVIAGAFLRPLWQAWNNYDTVYGYYEQPEDSFEVAFLGPSNVISGISPMELYRDYGIASYNYATEGQPMYCSLYWLKEAYRTQSDTLKTVVLDVSTLRDRTHKESAYHKAFDGMELSSVKIEAVMNHTDSINDALTFLIPLFSYHDRWSDLGEEDIEKFSYTANTSTLGYYLITTAYLEENEYDEMWIPDGALDEDDRDETLISEEHLEELEQIIDFCEENDLDLILIKTPHGYWNDAYHNEVQAIADDYDLTFLDMNFDGVFDEILDFNYATDTKDGAHPNYYGMLKITSYLGEYLTDNGLASDVRGDDDYAYLDEALEGYEEYVTYAVSLKETTDLVSYLETAISNENNVVCITAKDDAVSGLTDEVREALSALGLTELAALSEDDTYLAVIEGGTVTAEQTGEDEISFTLKASDGTKIRLVSGENSAIYVAGEEVSEGTGGLNIVVYQTTFSYVSDSAVFATRTEDGLTRTGIDYASALEEAILSGTLPEDLPDALLTLYQYNSRF